MWKGGGREGGRKGRKEGERGRNCAFFVVLGGKEWRRRRNEKRERERGLFFRGDEEGREEDCMHAMMRW